MAENQEHVIKINAGPRHFQVRIPEGAAPEELTVEELEQVAGGEVEGNNSSCTEVNIYKCAATAV